MNLLLCYSEQLEYILAYNYNGVKFLAPNGKHKIPFMFFPAHGKHLCIPDSVIDEHGVNVLMKSPGFEYAKCNCDRMVESRPTIIYCNPNALNYEQMVNYPHNFWLKYFMNHGCNVVIWNYRGYGCAKGTPNPKNLQDDGQALYEYIRKTLHITGKVGVYGRSLGGIVATHIAAKNSDISLLFADRTLANLEILPNRKAHGSIMTKFFKFATLGWKADNDENYYNAQAPVKMMAVDPADDVIDNHTSVMTGVAMKVACKKLKVKSINLKKQYFLMEKDEQKVFFKAIETFFEIHRQLCLSNPNCEDSVHALNYGPGGTADLMKVNVRAGSAGTLLSRSRRL